MIEEPRIGRIGPVFTDDAQRLPAEVTDFAMEFFDDFRIERTRRLPGMDGGTPKNFVGHPVADARKSFLHKEHRLDRRASATTKKIGQLFHGESRRK